MEEFLEQVATLGRIPEPELGEVCFCPLSSNGCGNVYLVHGRPTHPSCAWHDACAHRHLDSHKKYMMLLTDMICSMNCVQVLKKELTAPRYIYDSGLRDQNAIVYVMKAGWKEHKSHVLLINKQYCLNCYWKDLLQSGDLSSDDKKVHCRAPIAASRRCSRRFCRGCASPS